MRANPPPHAALRELTADCRATEAGSTNTFGFWFECGAGPDFGFEIMSAQGSEDETSEILIKVCGGIEFGGGLEFSFAYGYHGKHAHPFLASMVALCYDRTTILGMELIL